MFRTECQETITDFNRVSKDNESIGSIKLHTFVAVLTEIVIGDIDVFLATGRWTLAEFELGKIRANADCGVEVHYLIRRRH